jgi:hypothetical protein
MSAGATGGAAGLREAAKTRKVASIVMRKKGMEILSRTA